MKVLLAGGPKEVHGKVMKAPEQQSMVHVSYIDYDSEKDYWLNKNSDPYMVPKTKVQTYIQTGATVELSGSLETAKVYLAEECQNDKYAQQAIVDDLAHKGHVIFYSQQGALQPPLHKDKYMPENYYLSYNDPWSNTTASYSNFGGNSYTNWGTPTKHVFKTQPMEFKAEEPKKEFKPGENCLF